VGYVERNASGRTELRVHGVAGTVPESVLQHPHAEQIAGNRDAGFFRRWWEAQSVSADSPQRRREAYSWGGLTSGDNLRALWLLLLPFMLLNVAFYMAPYRRPPEPDEPTGWRERCTVWRRGWWSTPRRDRRRDRFSASVQRLLALSFTITFTLTAITVAMDLVGWKCAAPATGDVCGTSWLGWLDAAWLRDRPGRQVAVTALLPLAVVGLLWWLAGATWDKLERVRPPASDTAARPVEIETPLEDRAMWNGRGPVRRLRAVHVATGLALPGAFALAPLQANSAWRPTVLLALVAFLVAMVVVVAHPTIAHRERPSSDTGKEDDDERRSPFRFLPWSALALTVLGLAVAATGSVPEIVAETGMPAPAGTAEVRSTLPWLAGALQWTFVVQAVLLALLLAACWSLRRRARRAAADTDTGEEHRVGLRPAWHGFAMPAIALLAWVLAGGFSAGIVLRAADTLGTPVAPGYRGDDAYPLVVPLAYRWVAAAAFALAVAAVLSAVFVWVRVRRWKQATTDVAQAYGAAAEADEKRTEEIARAWARATLLTGEARRVLGFLLVVTVVVVLMAGVFFLFFRDSWVIDERLVTAGNAVLSASVLGLLWVGRQAYRNPAQRRTVGIVWDLGTFWPRAVHPLAPPCYAERAVPDLIGRLEYLTGTGTDGAGQDDGTVLLSCHSQGSVLGAVVLMQVGTPTSARTAFLTYGCPLARLYARFFPAYFSRTALDRLGGFLRDTDTDTDTDHRPAAAADADERATWRWRNLYRRSDPIGGAVFVDRPPVWSSARADPDDVDRPLLDPVFVRSPGDPCSPPIRGHSNYFADSAFAWTADALQSGRLPRAVAPEPAGSSASTEARGTV
jgi:hypothetical protein